MAKKRANGEGNIRKRADGRWEGRYTAGYHPETGKRIIKNVLGKTQGQPDLSEGCVRRDDAYKVFILIRSLHSQN